MTGANEVRQWLIGRTCTLLGLPGGTVTERTAFDDLGMDSITRAGLAREIEQRFRVWLDPEELFDHPTIEDLARRVARF
jgi:acyl carrier protein